MLIAQLSDPHVRPSGRLYRDVVDSNQKLSAAIDHLLQLDRRPDLVLVTGDLVDNGLPEEYANFLELLRALPIPYLVIPGNHDDREHFRATFAHHRHLPLRGPLHFCVDDYPVRIVALDSCVPRAHHGSVDDAALEWLQSTLQQRPQTPTLVLMHHPPFVSGIPYLDEYRCVETDGLQRVLRSFDQVEAVLCGHVHRAMLKRWAGTIVASCPSTATEIALRLDPAAQPATYLGPAACLLHRWEPADGLITHVSYIGSYPGPYRFF